MFVARSGSFVVRSPAVPPFRMRSKPLGAAKTAAFGRGVNRALTMHPAKFAQGGETTARRDGNGGTPWTQARLPDFGPAASRPPPTRLRRATGIEGKSQRP